MNTKAHFFLLILLLLIIAIANKMILNTDELLLNSLSEELTKHQAEKIFKLHQKWEWFGYIFIPLVQLIKIGLISSTLYIGLFFFDIKLTFNKLMLIVIKAEYIFVLVSLIKILWFVFQNDYTLEDLQFFYPLSALNIVGYKGLSPWFLYPFQVLNVFELIYWFLLAYFINKEINITTDKAFRIVASSYGSGLLIWVIFIMFFTLNVT